MIPCSNSKQRGISVFQNLLGEHEYGFLWDKYLWAVVISGIIHMEDPVFTDIR